jgi:hypothetical protein
MLARFNCACANIEQRQSGHVMIRLLTEIRAPGSSRHASTAPEAADVDTALNRDIAARLRLTADHLQAHDANPYRAASFRFAADMVDAQPRSLHSIYQRDGRGGLDALPGVGPGIAAIIDDILRTKAAEKTSRRRTRASQPPVQLLLDVDRQYRAQKVSGKVGAARELRVQRDGWHVRVFYSNSTRAQELARTRDWVIVVAARGDARPCQHTVVTETRGKLAGRRVVRGRESACRNYYSRLTPSATAMR